MVRLKGGNRYAKTTFSGGKKLHQVSLLESEGCRGRSWVEVKLEDTDDGPP